MAGARNPMFPLRGGGIGRSGPPSDEDEDEEDSDELADEFGELEEDAELDGNLSEEDEDHHGGGGGGGPQKRRKILGR